MAITLKIFDQTNAGEKAPAVILELVSERINARELLERRVRTEVERFNTEKPETFTGLVQPTDTERVLNGFRLRKARKLDWKKQFTAATEAFDKGRVYLLVDGRQLDSLDEELTLTSDTEVIFLKLVPLIGG